jgi:2-polyprenyl-6-methoxyphenol hydroxylase-like FAD-dependent oxidoreductase
MIQPTGLAVLRGLGLAEALIARSARIERLFGTANGRIVLDVGYDTLAQPGLCGFGVHRATLFAILHKAVVAAGIPLETGRVIVGSELVSGDRRRLTFADGRSSVRFDLIVDALGTRTPLAPPCGRTLRYGALWASLRRVEGFAPDALEQRYRHASTMAGVLPIGRPPGAELEQAAFFWSIRADRIAHWRAAGLDAWKDGVRELWPATAPLLDQIDDPAQLTFARYAHRTLPRPADTALIHIGDAWHSASPQLGQGANMALLDAHALAIGLRAADVGAGLAAAVALRRRHVRLYQSLTALFTPVYQSDSRVLPFVRDRLVGPLSGRWPANRIQAAMVSGLIGRPLAPLALTLA